MGSRTLLICAVLACAAAASARDAQSRPDMELLEYLGTFETAGGKPLDPMELKDEKLPEKSRQPPAPAKGGADKKQTKKPPRKEPGDE